MSLTPSPTIVIVPGLRDHVPDHWQTILANKIENCRSVPLLEKDRLACDAQVAALDELLSDISGEVVLVAHSAGVMTTVHWAQQHQRPVKGALLAAPPDFESPLPEGYPTLESLVENGWTPTPRTPLPFPSIVAGSTNDPLADADRVADLARAWGSRLTVVGPVGHLNPASGYGEWPQAEEFIRELTGASSGMPD
ncbi:RBBP9/YdeN family alpha/beta hydrolase [Streptomyces malaysiensis]|uniref:RBBP9/YdeN family alpha/beta hydrolase n=1 Tax=Streptomyces malaysiensis TaxID=92644 RepID=UPI000C2B5D1E|nr:MULTISPECIES: alpha/beta hydrolase [unclassified Streptomyces]AUA08052.1 Alpha/beta hydrolase family protein [Streptomyces sp. M56]MYX62128.1 alpha/beta fold hydrolase [Streptomyces sp. SID8382]